MNIQKFWGALSSAKKAVIATVLFHVLFTALGLTLRAEQATARDIFTVHEQKIETGAKSEGPLITNTGEFQARLTQKQFQELLVKEANNWHSPYNSLSLDPSRVVTREEWAKGVEYYASLPSSTSMESVIKNGETCEVTIEDSGKKCTMKVAATIDGYSLEITWDSEPPVKLNVAFRKSMSSK